MSQQGERRCRRSTPWGSPTEAGRRDSSGAMTRLAISLLAACALGLTLPSAGASLPNDFRTYPSCDIRERDVHGTPTPDRSCGKGDRFGAVLISRHVPIRYRLCFRRPDGRHRCVRKSADRVRPSTVALYLRADRHAVGKWRLKWLNYWHGHVVIGRDKLHVRR